ncbi:MAG: SulP family inorganic anion transporter [Leptonema sp. (in: bacteria)]
MLAFEFKPKFFSLLKEKEITRKIILKDLLAGTVVGIVALPLAIAFAIASGVTPEKGLITAIVAGFLISLLGGSRVQIGGPTGAFIVIVYEIVHQYGTEGLTLATFLAGFILIGLGILKLGNLLKFISHSLIVGFTTGIAIIIFTSQLKDFLGLKIQNLPGEFLHKIIVIWENLHSINYYALGIGLISISIIIITPKFIKKIPGSILALLFTTIIVQYFNIPVETIESRFGEISNIIPKPQFYLIDFKTFIELFRPAIAIALLGAIESLLSAIVADGMIGGNHRPNTELIAQGIANVASSMFGGIPATGAIARTATNIKNGGRTPIAGMFHAIVLLMIMWIASPIAKKIPLATLAGILIVVSYNMSELHQFIAILKTNKYEITLLLSTFLLTVFVDLVIAIEVGVILSSFILMIRMSNSLKVEKLFDNNGEQEKKDFEKELGTIPDNILLYEINGPFFFGAAQSFAEIIKDSFSNINLPLQQKHLILILRMRYVPFIDLTGIQRLKNIIQTLSKKNVMIVFSGVNETVKKELLQHKVTQEKFIHSHIQSALDFAKSL